LDEKMDVSGVPQLLDILNYLPLDTGDDVNILEYIRNTVEFIALNYKNEHYTFSYLGVHLICMMYLYISAWKISIVIPEEHDIAVTFAKTYEGDEIDTSKISSVFDYSRVPEKELPKILKLIGLDKGQRGKIRGLVDMRNDIAHATGKSKIPNEDAFYNEVNTIHSFIRNINNCMNGLIRKWFSQFLVKYCEDEYKEYKDINDIIQEQMIQNLYLSVNELIICNEMSVKKLIKENPNNKLKLEDFKSGLKKYCTEKGYA